MASNRQVVLYTEKFGICRSLHVDDAGAISGLEVLFAWRRDVNEPQIINNNSSEEWMDGE